MAGIGQIFGQRRCIFFVVNWCARFHFTHHYENVTVIVNDRYDAGPQHQYGKCGTVRGHIAPIQLTDVRFIVEYRIAVAQQRWTA